MSVMILIIIVKMPIKHARMLKKGNRETPAPAALELRRDIGMSGGKKRTD
jgi:hypothetical protein